MRYLLKILNKFLIIEYKRYFSKIDAMGTTAPLSVKNQKMSLECILLLFAISILSINSFSRQFRHVEFTLHDNSSSYRWDLIIDHSEVLRNNNYQDLLEQYDQKLNANMSAFHDEYSDDIYRLNNYGWLQYTDYLSQKTFKTQMEEVYLLRKGQIVPRAECNLLRTVNDDQCLYSQLSAQYGIIYQNLTPNSLLSRPGENLFGLYEISLSLFNNQWYYHAEALTMFSLFHIIPTFYQTFFANHNVSQEIVEIEWKFMVLLSEIQRVRNRLGASVVLSLRYIRGLHRQDSSQLEKFERNAAVSRLRVLITLPILPPPTHIAQYHRKEIIEDLIEYSKYLVDHRITLPLAEAVQTIAATPFLMAHEGLNDLDFQLAYTRVLLTLCPSLSYHNELIPSVLLLTIPTFTSPTPRTVKVKIGFLSSHFFDHSIGRMLIELILLLHEEITATHTEKNILFKPELFVYFLDTKQSHYLHQDDYITTLYQTRLGSQFYFLSTDIEKSRQQIAKDQLDFLVFADLGMDLHSFAIAFSRLATYQIAWWGHPITSGLFTIDYFFSLEEEIITANEHYSEQLVRMETINTIPLHLVAIDQTQRNSILHEAGLPVNAKFAVVLGRIFKFHPDFEQILVNLLITFYDMERIYPSSGSTPSSYYYYLVVYAEKVVDYNQLFLLRLQEHLQEHPRNFSSSEQSAILQRLRMVQYARFYHQLSPFAEVALDSHPYGGCVTTHDAFHFGLPVVSLPSSFIRGRFTLGMYRQMEVMDLIVDNPQEYQYQVIRLLTNETYQGVMTQKIQEGFEQTLKQNRRVAEEWFLFLIRLFS